MKKALIAFLLQLPLIVLTKDVALSETNNRDNTTQIELEAAKQFISTESTTNPNETSTISGADNGQTEAANVTLKIDTTTAVPKSTTTLEDLLIPPATVDAQIVNADISTKKPSRLQLAA